MAVVALSPQARADAIDAMAEGQELDVLVVGGGVVGTGAALDAATRGLTTGLLEARDFASGTSSRSSKLIHGGLRYLEMLDFRLVHEALQERGLLLQRLAPHLVKPVPFLYPLQHRWWERFYAGAGVALYDGMAVSSGLSRPADPQAPDPPRRDATRPIAEEVGSGRSTHVLRRPGRRRPAHDGARADGRVVRRSCREPGQGHRLPASR
ncbi:hypothetical protein GCM10029976_010690 [Kribbella albertanoniae]